MTNPTLQKAYLPHIELCWKISEETEDMADFAKEHVEECWPVLVLLAQSTCAAVALASLFGAPFVWAQCQQLLRTALNDTDAYCKRRALLSLASLSPRDSMKLKACFIQDNDPYIRQAAEECKP